MQLSEHKEHLHSEIRHDRSQRDENLNFDIPRACTVDLFDMAFSVPLSIAIHSFEVG